MKEGGLAPLAPHFGRVVKAYVIGRAAEDTALGLAGVAHEVSGDMAAAVAHAAAEAAPGEVVLLAPAGASFDQYDNFEARGEDFMAEVARVLGRT
jgi:UDP-N-acetylmuramoylalanine--D-glutamate ligase